MPPLTIHVWYHRESRQCRDLAMHLHRVLNGPSLGWGLRIPVQFGRLGKDGGPPPLLEPAPHGLLLVLVDVRMARGGTPADRELAEAWDDRLVEMLEKGPPDARDFSVLPVAVDEEGLELSDRLSEVSFLRLGRFTRDEQRRWLTLHTAARSIRLLEGHEASDQRDASELPRTGIQFFLSHAKQDLPTGDDDARGPVKALHALSGELPVHPWIDAREIPAGGRFDDEIRSGILRSSVVVVVLTDAYSSREWCRREVLDAKAAGRPIVLVDALEARVARLFPYVGNTPVVRWRAALARTTADSHPHERPAPIRQWEAEDARVVLEVALLEGLRYLHEVDRLRQQARADEYVLGTHPEALTILNLPDDVCSVLYPDPPLGREELERLTPVHRDLDLVTPLQRLAQWEKPSNLLAVALSLSDAPDAEDFGGSYEHLATMAHDLALYLLLAGLQLVYGGSLLHADLGSSSVGEDNYVRRLLELVREHSPLALQIREAPLEPVHNWVAWPMYHEMSAADRNLYRKHTGLLQEVPPPPDLDVQVEFKPGPGGEYPCEAPSWRYARARALSYMRELSTAECSARILLGGRVAGYAGQLPGLVEEGVMSLRAGKPLFVLGGCGGAAHVVAETLRGGVAEELTADWCRAKVPGWEDLAGEYGRRGHVLPAPEEIAVELRDLGARGAARALRNGLDERENEELFEMGDPHRAVELILRGLRAVFI